MFNPAYQSEKLLIFTLVVNLIEKKIDFDAVGLLQIMMKFVAFPPRNSGFHFNIDCEPP